MNLNNVRIIPFTLDYPGVTVTRYALFNINKVSQEYVEPFLHDMGPDFYDENIVILSKAQMMNVFDYTEND